MKRKERNKIIKDLNEAFKICGKSFQTKDEELIKSQKKILQELFSSYFDLLFMR